MTNPDDIERDLGGLLADVTPSTTFAARVRTRVAEDAARGSRRAVFAWAISTATVMSAVLVGVVEVRKPTVHVQPRSSTSAALAAGPVVTAVAPAGAVGARLHSTLSGHPRTPTAGGAATVSTEVLVPDDERLALIHLLQGLKEDRASVPATLGPRFDADGKLLPPEPVVIEPLPELAPAESDSSVRTVKAGTSGGANQ
jgi:hypothetical protein